jgi:hypothetical protein
MSKNIVSHKSKKRKHEILGTVIKVKGRTVGQVISDEYVKDITDRHMLTNPPAIANDIQALHDAERAGALWCVFTNIDKGIIYRASIAKIHDMGKHVNYGWGDQIMLTLQNWTQTRDPEFASHTDTVTPEYSDPTDTHDETEVLPLNIKSHAPVGVKFTKAPKQLSMWGRK